MFSISISPTGNQTMDQNKFKLKNQCENKVQLDPLYLFQPIFQFVLKLLPQFQAKLARPTFIKWAMAIVVRSRISAPSTVRTWASLTALRCEVRVARSPEMLGRLPRAGGGRPRAGRRDHRRSS
jgi:hypothetical protein